MAVFDNLKPTSFDGIAFSVSSCTVKGKMRDHVHVFPHSPGGKPELMARDLYVVEMEAVFSTNLRNYPSAYPNDMNDLRGRFEKGTISDLYLPTIGSITAYATEWDQTFVAKRRDGETTKYVFREYQDTEALILANSPIQYQSIQPKAEALEILIDEEDLDTDIFSAINDAVTSVLAIVDQAELQSNLLASQLETLADVCREVDETASALQHPEHWRVAVAVRDIGVAAIQLQQDTLRRIGPTLQYVVPTLMSISDVSRAIYGTSDRSIELLLLNAIPDAYAIRPGFVIRAYAPAQTLIAA